jgi:hypothetical protein
MVWRSRARPGAADRDLDDLERRLVWVMGSPRTGSTWLLNLLARNRGVVGIDEPLLGAHLEVSAESLAPGPDDVPFRGVYAEHRARPDYFFSDEFAPVWRPLLRELVLARMAAHVEWSQARRYRRRARPVVLIKEPHGSQAADLLIDVLPQSKLLVLLRDPRDVFDSALDAAAGDWQGRHSRTAVDLAPADRRRVLHATAQLWLGMTDAVFRAEARLPEAQRLRMRYEDLRRDTERELARIVAWLDLPMTEAQITERASKLTFENLPSEDKGPGKFLRAATPGMWRDNLTNDEQQAIEGWIGPRLAELGYP